MKPTGPGKIQTAVTPPGAPVQGSVALLFNFDFDGETVKPEHKQFLLENFVPPLLTALDVRVFLRGTASQAGDAAYNLQLSRRRVEAVRSFLLGTGVRPPQIVSTFSGENLSTSLIPDDEKDRAVEAILEASTGPARFDRMVPVETLDGFHGESNPQRMVVGTPEVDFVRLLGAHGSIVESLTPGVVQVTDPFRPGVSPLVATSDNMLLQLKPGTPGRGQVVSRLPGQLARVPSSVRLALFSEPISGGEPPSPPAQSPTGSARLDVATVFFKTVSVTFHYVIGPSGSVGVTTLRQPNASFEQSLIGVMNGIYLRQTRIRFAPPSQRVVHTDFSGPITIGTDKVIVSSQHTQNIDETARIRIFFVGNIEVAIVDGKKVDPFAHTPVRPGKNFVVRDSITPRSRLPAMLQDVNQLGIVLAHECGHCFGIAGIKPPGGDTNLLMHEENQGVVIPQQTAVEMHKHVNIP